MAMAGDGGDDDGTANDLPEGCEQCVRQFFVPLMWAKLGGG